MGTCKSFVSNDLAIIAEKSVLVFLEYSVNIKSDFHQITVAGRMADKQDFGCNIG